MADKSISQLGTATALTGDELTVVVQNGVTKQTQLQDIADLGGPAGPVGPQGPTGPTGPGATIQVNSTTTGAPGTNASVTNVGSLQTAMFDFVIPRGDVGATGATGATGPQGPGVAAGGTVGQVLIKASSVDYATAWLTLTGTGTVTSVDVDGGTTGLTFSGGPITAAGTITMAGTLDVANGGTGTISLTGYVKGNGVAPFSASSTIPTTDLSGTISNLQLANSAITINGNSVSLGGSTTVTATATNALTIGSGLSGTSYNGSAPVTISLTNNSITLGTTTIALGGTSLAPVGLTSVTVTQDPVSALQLATKQYVDTLASSGIHYHDPVYVESPDTAGNLNATYNQPGGAGDGVGATLTNAGTQVALTIDGVLMTVGKRVLIYNQTNGYENGIYTVTTVGTGSTNWVLTRATDADTYSPFSPDSLGQGDAFFVQAGATGIGETYICNTVGVITFGTTDITFAQISSAQVYSAGTGLTLTGTQFSISNTAATAGTYGTDARNTTLTVNAQGQITNIFDQPISIAPSQINATIPNSGLTNSSITINGSAISLGGSVSVGTVTSVTGTAPVVSSGGTTPAISMAAANTSTNGYLTSTDWNTFNSKGTGSVTSVSGTGTVSGISLSGTVTTSGSLTLGGTLDLSSPPAIGGTTPAAITGTTITATNYVGISGGTFYMAATGYTPISLYYSTTAAATPTAGNLVPGELAINITDGKLYYEDNAGVVQLLASKTPVLGNSLTIALTGGATAPATFNGSSAVTIDYSTVGADQVGTGVAMAIALG